MTIEAIYKFPIHEAAAICAFEAGIDGNRTVKGIVKEAQQAAKEYNEAVQVCIDRLLTDYQVVTVCVSLICCNYFSPIVFIRVALARIFLKKNFQMSFNAQLATLRKIRLSKSA